MFFFSFLTRIYVVNFENLPPLRKKEEKKSLWSSIESDYRRGLHREKQPSADQVGQAQHKGL